MQLRAVKTGSIKGKMEQKVKAVWIFTTTYEKSFK